MDIEEVKRLLKAKIRKLEKQLELYRALLELLESGCSGVQTPIAEIHDEEGNIIARVYKTPSGIRVQLSKPLAKDNIYLKHLQKRLKRLQEEGVAIEYKLEGDEEIIQAIEVIGNLEDEILSTVLRLLDFALPRAYRRQSAS